MSWLLTNLFAALLLPPLNLLLISIAGLLLLHRKPQVASALLTVSIALIWLLSTPIIAYSLLQSLEEDFSPIDYKSKPAEAIVVLGGGTYFNAPEYAGDTVGDATLLRLRYAAKLYRDLAKPILVTGGKPLGNTLSEAQQMRQALEQEFSTPVQWTEDESDNTYESARYSFKQLQQHHIKNIYLITHAWHMPRALRAFRTAGFNVIPAPTAYTTRYKLDLLAFLPNARALQDSRIYFHEAIGILWYRLKS